MEILITMKGLPLAYNKDMQEDKEAIFDTIKTLKSTLEVITPFINSITFNTDIMGKASQSEYLNATKLLESLVLKGIPFRDAHHKVGSLVAEAM
jgi:argininosuccinate lyase